MKDTAGNNTIEFRKVGIDVEGKAVYGDPFADTHAEGGNLLSFDPDTGQPLLPVRLNIELCKSEDDDLFEATEIAVNIGKVPVQIDDRIPDDLSRTMVGDIPSTVDAEDLHPANRQLLLRCEKMILVPPFADRIDMVVLSKEEQVVHKPIMAKVKQPMLKIPRFGIPCTANIGNEKTVHVTYL